MIKKISTAVACAACFAALTVTASAATNPVGRAANGAINAGEDLINGVADAGEDIVNGVTGGRTNGTDNNTNGTTNGANNGNTNNTNNPTVSEVPDVTDTDDSDLNSGLVTASDVTTNQTPATGISFGLTASAAMLGALGVVLTANRRGE